MAGYSKTGVLLMAYGGPKTIEEVEPFLEAMTGRKPSHQTLDRVIVRYEAIGGGSPLPTITEQQASLLERDLDWNLFEAFAGYQYTHPLIGETVEFMAQHGIEHAVGVSMSPFSSRVTSDAYVESVRRATRKTNKPEFLFVLDWHKEPLFHEAVADKVKESVSNFAGEKPVVVFTAHSLPKRYVEEGDPYVDEFDDTIGSVVALLGGIEWRKAYQSKGHADGEWLGPDAGDVFVQLAKEGKRSVLVVPLGFAADHVETLYDIDILMRQQAEDLGLRFERSESLNTTPKFIDALTRVVRERLGTV